MMPWTLKRMTPTTVLVATEEAYGGETNLVSPIVPGWDNEFAGRVGFGYQWGHGVERDLDEAMRWFRTARKQSHGAALNRVLLRYPLMTTKVIAGIHMQALKLWMKKVPFFVHPKKRKAALEAQG